MRRLGFILLGIALAAGTFGGICVIGVTATMRESFPTAATAGDWPEPKAVVPGRIAVAVVVGSTGSVVSDVLAPYEVFARSDAFSVYTVSARRAPTALSGGLNLLPDHTFAEVGAGRVPAPDVVVVPAVVEPTGEREKPLRDFVADRAARGARILGVCAGVEVVAATGLLDGRPATSFWDNMDRLAREYPEVNWVRGKRYVEDGPLVTTAGVTSGVSGALRVMRVLAGTAEAERVGRELAYPGWSLESTDIPAQRRSIVDAPYVLNATFPLLRPGVGVGLVDGVGELDVAAVFEVYSGTSSAARLVPLAAAGTVTTRHGVALLAHPAGAGGPAVDRLVVPGVRTTTEVPRSLTRWAADRGIDVTLPHAGQAAGEFSFDPVLRDLAAHTDTATARMTAKFTEYPAGRLSLTGSPWPWRSTILAVLSLILAAAAGLLPALVRRAFARRRAVETDAGVARVTASGYDPSPTGQR